MKFVTTLLALGAAAVATASWAQDVETPPAKPAKEKKICRRQETTGSIMTTSICHTAAQWNAIDEDNSKRVESRRDARTSSAN